MFFVSSNVQALLIFCFDVPLNTGECFKFKKRLPAVNVDSSLLTMQGVVTLYVKKYGEHRLSVLNDRREFLHKIHTFVTPHCKQGGESQLSLLNNTGSICY
jgi:hypothetical protein